MAALKATGDMAAGHPDRNPRPGTLAQVQCRERERKEKDRR